MRSRAQHLVLLVALFLAGCAAPQNVGQANYALKGTYATGLKAAVEYKRLPSCLIVPRPTPCSDPAIVERLQKGDDRAYGALGDLERGVIAFSAAKAIVDSFRSEAEKAKAGP